MSNTSSEIGPDEHPNEPTEPIPNTLGVHRGYPTVRANIFNNDQDPTAKMPASIEDDPPSNVGADINQFLESEPVQIQVYYKANKKGSAFESAPLLMIRFPVPLERFWFVQSATDLGKLYIVDSKTHSCNCSGYGYRNTCTHADEVLKKLTSGEPE